MTMTELAARLRTIRQARGLSQAQLVTAIHYTGYRALERGDMRHRAWCRAVKCRLPDIARELGVSADDILADNWRRRCAQDGISLEMPK